MMEVRPLQDVIANFHMLVPLHACYNIICVVTLYISKCSIVVAKLHVHKIIDPILFVTKPSRHILCVSLYLQLNGSSVQHRV
jgi:hypothetical protein